MKAVQSKDIAFFDFGAGSMPLMPFESYRTVHPELPRMMLSFFSLAHLKDSPGARTIQDFIQYYSQQKGGSILQPEPLTRIADQLVSFGWMSRMHSGGSLGLQSSYIAVLRDESILTSMSALRLMTCGIYGLSAVYDLYSPSVIPLINEQADGNVQIGTAFIVGQNRLATAFHCLENASKLSIRGVSLPHLNRAIFYVHANVSMDLAVIEFDESIFIDRAVLSLADANVPR